VALFKRRKLDDPQAPETPVEPDPTQKLRSLAAELPKPSEAIAPLEVSPPVVADPPKPAPLPASITPPYPPGLLSKQPENTLGVPPFRPTTSKDQFPMGRTPFATSPSAPPATTPAISSSNPVRTSTMAIPAPRPVTPPEPSERRTLVVGRGISLQGVVQDAERLVVEGTVEATMIHAKELFIAQGGIFKGECEVEEAEVAGTIDGTLTTRASLIIRATGKVMGTARYKRLQVEDGGLISGRMEMLTTETPKPIESAAE
jgi:cytoskeletal protein CcmA (bactofilin family)